MEEKSTERESRIRASFALRVDVKREAGQAASGDLESAALDERNRFDEHSFKHSA